jgi:hypothetical protein
VSPEKEAKSGLHLTTLLISSAAAVAAAVIVPMFWERGSLLATAITPIIVAIVTETLNRPAKVITTQVTPRVTRRSATGAAVRAEQPPGVGARGEGPEQVSRWGSEDDPFGLRAPERAPRRRFPLKLAVVTGLLAALIGVVTVTASELALFGHSVGNSGRSTSVWGGSETPREEEQEATPTATPEATETASPEATATATATPTEAPTITPTPTVSAVPTPATTPPPELTPAPTP